jgi:hypothetical protein
MARSLAGSFRRPVRRVIVLLDMCVLLSGLMALRLRADDGGHWFTFT